MGIGSFLSNAGYIGAEAEQFVNTREVQRAARAQAQAQQLEMARQEQRRLERMAMPDLDPNAPTYDIGAPGSIAAGEFGVPPVTAGVTPVSAPAPAGGRPAAGVAPPTTAPKRMFAGVEVPYYDKNAPERIAPADKNASDFSKFIGTDRDRAALAPFNRRISELASNVFGRTGASKTALIPAFASQSEKADAKIRQRAADWYNGDNARAYFSRNPDMVAVAEKDPLGFFNTVMTPPPKRAAAPKAAAPKAAATQDLRQYANVPFSQVRDRIVSIESTNYDTIAYDRGNRNLAGVRAPQPVSTMTIGQVLDFQRNQMRPQTKGFRDSKDVGSTGVGRYQFESNTLEENAKKAFGKDFRNMQFTPETQDTIAETLWDTVKGDPKRLAKTWGAFGGKQAGTTPAAAGGVQENAATRVAQEPLAASDFYLAKPEMISRDTSNAVQMRQLLVQRANEFKKFGMIEEFDQARGELIGLDNNIRMLQGLQGITELETARDPRRLAAVWSDYAGTPVQIQPRTDGLFDIVVNGRVTSRGVDGAQIRDVARSTFDKAYLQQRVETSSASAMENLKSQLRINEATASELIKSAASIEQARVEGNYRLAEQRAKNLEEKLFTTPGGEAYIRGGGSWQQLIPNYRAPGLPESIPAGPAAVPIAGLRPRMVSAGTGG